MNKYQEQIANGVKLLDAKVPNWETEIDLHILNLQQFDRCVLGQLGHNRNTDFYGMKEKLGLDDSFSASMEHGFLVDHDYVISPFAEYKLLTIEWKNLIRTRRGITTEE